MCISVQTCAHMSLNKKFTAKAMEDAVKAALALGNSARKVQKLLEKGHYEGVIVLDGGEFYTSDLLTIRKWMEDARRKIDDIHNDIASEISTRKK